MERDLFVDFAGEIHIGGAAFGAGLHDDATYPARVDFSNFHPNGAGINARGYNVVENVMRSEGAVAGENGFRRSKQLPCSTMSSTTP